MKNIRHFSELEKNENRLIEKLDAEKTYEFARRRIQEYTRDPAERESLGREPVRKPSEFVRRREIAAALLADAVSRYKWLGEDVKLVRPHDKERAESNVDFVAQFPDPKNPQERAALGITVTWTGDTVHKTVQEIKARVYADQTDQFQSIGQQRIPRAIIGLSKKTIEELVPLWMNPKQEELGDHEARQLILEELQSQLTRFDEYAYERDSRKHLDAYDTILPAVNKMLGKEKASERTLSEELQNDDVARAIARSSTDFERMGMAA